MTCRIAELKEQIYQKNIMLASFADCSCMTDSDYAKTIESELDILLYQYYKLLGKR